MRTRPGKQPRKQTSRAQCGRLLQDDRFYPQGMQVDQKTERWLSGLRCSPGKRVYGDTVPGVRIPPSPPLTVLIEYLPNSFVHTQHPTEPKEYGYGQTGLIWMPAPDRRIRMLVVMIT
jgi:hypothetical protein